MSGSLPFGKFFWSDYASDPALKVCSFAAQGLWMRMLCVAAEHAPLGYVAINGRGLDAPAIARITGGSSDEVNELLAELESNGVFSRDRRGWIYSRRMIRDAKKARNARENGRKGGNPKLAAKHGEQRTNPQSDNQKVKPQDNGDDKPHIPESRDQSNSVDKSTAASGDPDKAFWDSAKAYLGKGKASLIGKWVSEHGREATAAAIAAAQVERAVNPVEFIQGRFRKQKVEESSWDFMP